MKRARHCASVRALGDRLGSASLATNSSGAVVANGSTRYYPYGAMRSGGTGLPTDYRFTGQLLDASSGLYHMGARWYDPMLARWVSADTIVPSPVNPQSLNRYSYVLGNPLGLVDPSGHDECSPTGACTDDEEVPDARDLTESLVAEANADAASWLVLFILSCNRHEQKLLAWTAWYQQVHDGARWDFKDAIEQRVGPVVQLGESWFEYSTPGNMLYGFTGAAAGFSAVELHGGASVAQLLDDRNSDDPKDDRGPWRPSFFDQEDDYYAIEFGIRLYEDYGSDVKVGEFRALLVSYEHGSQFGRVAAPGDYMPAQEPYRPGRFDGGN